jgi:hypothetical protein
MTNTTQYPYRALATLRELFATTPGLMTARRNLTTGGWNLLLSAAEAGLDTDGGAFAVVCEDHGTTCSHTSRQVALSHLPYGSEWCETCREALDGRLAALADLNRGNREDR